ncbi:cysteine desulfurase family protein [Saliterribacillus persicus]|uniref:cysteine desulfurase n=1 Tax=Saliterribacillus persicus TaxID=930114 RepID=A0A368XES2_9BACI|nr:cysteine desulfurase family protein [Saliterribacillus persicus]RCW66450.1 cysteine desulfurase [Saliterribacillus persicus]
MKQIYLDHAATTPMDPAVIDEMTDSLKNLYGNPSSIHSFGRKARQALDKVRRTTAKVIGADEKEVTFTSGGTEANNLALIGTAFRNKSKGNHIITTKIEHHAVLHAAEYLEKNGFRVTYLDVDKDGMLDVEKLKASLTQETILVSVMMVNNETGVFQPISEIGQLIKDHQAYFHTDAVQALGLTNIHVDNLSVDLLTVSSHKINGPKGLGVLYVKKGTKLDSRQHGGEQERKRRPGTENVAGIIGFGKALEIAEEKKQVRKETYLSFKELFLKILDKNEISYYINGSKNNTIEHIINLSFPGTNVESLLTNFDLEGIAASSGSACSAGSVEPSHVLVSMYGSENSRIINSIRFSFGLANDLSQVELAANKIAKIVKRLTK